MLTMPSTPAAASSDGHERLAKIMARRDLCSRREAERLIGAGQVEVDGVIIAEQGVKVRPDALIRINRIGQQWIDGKVTILLNKPVGVVSTQPEGDQVPAWKLLTAEAQHGAGDPAQVARVLKDPYYLNVAGRLDRDSCGLLVLTTDGLLVKRITAGRSLDKVYHVVCDQPVAPPQLGTLNRRMILDGEPLLPMQVTRLQDGPDHLRFVLREGRNRQIRRCCEQIGLRVKSLLRINIGPWSLADLPEGKWRLISADERAAIDQEPAEG